jgi:prepilin signal peptidase PulO-like enzyme (type II secretory pathway)
MWKNSCRRSDEMQYLILLPILLLGIVLAYLINYLSDVLPRTRGFSKPVCAHCEKELGGVGYFLLRKCSNCGNAVSNRSKVVMIVVPILVVFLWVFPPHNLNIWIAYVCVVFFGGITIIDLEHRVILNEMSLFGAVLGFIVGYSINGLTTTLIGGGAGFLIMLGLYLLGELFARYMARRRGLDSSEVALGFGDVNLGGILGLMLGWPVVIACLLFAILIGGLISAGLVVWMLLRKDYKPFTAIPYAPFLILSGSILLYMLK